MKANAALLEGLLNSVKDTLDSGFIFIFAGPVPDSADDALDMDNDHTQIAMLSLDNDGETGLEFDGPDGGTLSKPADAVWEGTNEFDGAEDGETELTPTFMRHCVASDNGRDAAPGSARIQGSAGGPASAANMKLESAAAIANGSNTSIAASYNVRLTPVA
jgi:hypothetical protein